MNPSNIYIIVGASGSGKSTLVQNLLKSDLCLARVITHTTRKPRINEKNNQDYIFISTQEFLGLRAENYFIESSNAYGNWYGTSKKAFNNTNQAQIIILDSDCAINIQNNYPNAYIIYIPTAKEMLSQRILQRGDTDNLELRMSIIDQELQKLENINKYIVQGTDFLAIFEEVYKYIKKSKKNVDII